MSTSLNKRLSMEEIMASRNESLDVKNSSNDRNNTDSKVSIESVISELEKKGEQNQKFYQSAMRLGFLLESINKIGSKGDVNNLLNKLYHSNDFDSIEKYITDLDKLVKKYREEIEKTEIEAKEKQDAEKKRNFKAQIEEVREIAVTGTVNMDDWEDFKKDIPLPSGVELNQKQLGKVEKLYGNMVESANKQMGYLREMNYVLDSMLDQLEDIPMNHTGEIILKVNDKGFFRELGGLLAGAADWGFNKANYKEGADFAHDLLPNFNGTEDLAFSSKEEALETIKLWKEELKSIENIDWGSIAKNILLQAFSFLNATNLFLFDIIVADLEFIGDNIMNPIGWLALGANFVAYTKLRMFFTKASTGINLDKIKEFDRRLGETIKLYEDVGYFKNSDDLAGMKSFRGELTKIVAQNDATGVVDTHENTRQVYKLLQDFKGNILLDKIGFAGANIGEFVKGDGGMFPGKTLGLYDKAEKRFRGGKLGWTLDKVIRAYLIVPRWVTIGINRGVRSSGFGWRLRATSSDVIYDAIEATGEVNHKFKTIFSLIDGIDTLTPSEKKRLKGKIMENYRGSLPGDRLNPFQKYKLNFSEFTPAEAEQVQGRFNSILTKFGEKPISSTVDGLIQGYTAIELLYKNLTQMSKDDFKRGLKNGLEIFKQIELRNEIKNLFGWLKSQFFHTLKLVKKPYINIDEKTASILLDYIDSHPNIDRDDKIKKLAKKFEISGKEYDTKIEAIGKVADEFEKFIQFFPEISGDQERILQKTLDLNKKVPDDIDLFTSKFLSILNDKLGDNLDFNDIKAVNEEIGDDIVRIQPLERGIIQEKISKICKLSGKTGPQEDTILKKINTLLTKNQTFWQPHLSLYLKNLVETNGDILGISFRDVMNFKGDNLNYRSTFSAYLDKMIDDLNIDSSGIGNQNTSSHNTPDSQNQNDSPNNQPNQSPDNFDTTYFEKSNSGNIELSKHGQELLKRNITNVYNEPTTNINENVLDNFFEDIKGISDFKKVKQVFKSHFGYDLETGIELQSVEKNRILYSTRDLLERYDITMGGNGQLKGISIDYKNGKIEVSSILGKEFSNIEELHTYILNNNNGGLNNIPNWTELNNMHLNSGKFNLSPHFEIKATFFSKLAKMLKKAV